MISDIFLDFNEAVDVLDALFPADCWQSILEDLIKGDNTGIPELPFVTYPHGPMFHLSDIATFAIEYSATQSSSAADLVESMLEHFVLDTQTDDSLDQELNELLGELTGETAA